MLSLTLTVTVQLPPAAMVPPLRLMLLALAVGLKTPAHVLPVPLTGDATVMPAGNVSANPTPLRLCVAFGFVMVRLSCVTPFTRIVFGVNDFAIVGGATTVIVAVDVLPVPPSVEDTVTLLFFTPAVMPVTFTESMQVPLPVKVPPERLTLPELAVAVGVPLQVLLRPGLEATLKPLGNVSVKAMPVSGVVLGLVMVKVSDVLPFKGRLAAPKAFVIVGGTTTAVVALPQLVAGVQPGPGTGGLDPPVGSTAA